MITPPYWLHSSPESQFSHLGGHQDHTHGTIFEQYIIIIIIKAVEKEIRTQKIIQVSSLV